MSLEIKKATGKHLPNRYFLYLNRGQIAKSVLYTYPWLHWFSFLNSIFVLHRAGFNWLEILRFGGTFIQIHRRLNAVVVEFRTPLTAEQIDWAEAKLDVVVEPVKAVSAFLDKAAAQVGVSTVKNTTNYTGNGIKVAVIDTGINDSHPDLAGKVIARQDFSTPLNAWSFFNCFKKKPVVLDGVGHGTWCAGAIAGGGKTYQGMAPKVALIDARVLNDQGQGSNDSVIKGMSWAASQGADIISMSLGGQGTPDDATSREAEALIADGIVVVVAAGNEGPLANTIGSPSCAENVITVAAVDQKNVVAHYSSRGPVIYNGKNLQKPDIAAPGGGTTPENSCYYANGVTSVKSADVRRDACTVMQDAALYQRMSGTSMATPIVAGICALILEAANWTSRQANRCALVKQLIKSTAKQLPPYHATDCGAGLVDAKAAIDSIIKG